MLITQRDKTQTTDETRYDNPRNTELHRISDV